MTHDQLLDLIAGKAAELGVLAMIIPDSRKIKIGKGYVDVTLAGRRGVIFAEVKTAGDSMRPEQTTWRWQLLASGQRWRLWRPGDWTTGVIEADLKEIA